MGLLLLLGCEGSDASKAVTDTVKTVSGGELAKKGQEVEKRVNESMKEEAKRLLKTNDQKEHENPEGEEGSRNDNHE
jgi:hypothetical protein